MLKLIQLKKMSLSELSVVEKEELIVSLAALICADGSVATSKENLDTLIEKSGNKVDSYWTAIFASHLEGKNVLDMIASGVSAAAAPAAAGAAAASTDAPAEEKKEEEEEEEEDLGGAGGLFGGDDDDDW
ncbi:hypothetical protein WA158_003440 [Blastocystis sp. Blastoise]